MSKTLAAVLCGFTLTIGAVRPASAMEAGQIVDALFETPVRLVLFSTGAVIGTPIAIVRKTAQNTVETSESLGGKSESKVRKAGAGLMAVPVGIFTGSLEGVYLATENGWTHSGDKPFSKEYFSLGDLKD